MIESVIKPKRPKGTGWVEMEAPPSVLTLGYPAQAWFHREGQLKVISAVEVAHDPHDIEKGPEYHVSVSKYPGQRCSRNEARFVLKAFDMEHADEDNHVPNGIARNFWKPVAEKLIGHVCPCKDEEPAMIEDKGEFVWRGITK